MRSRALPFLAAVTVLAAPPGAAQGPYLGRPVREVLLELREAGLELIFSSATVADDLRVTAEPAAGPPRAILDQILAPLGLAAREGPDGTVLVLPGRPVAVLRGYVRAAENGAAIAGARVRVAGTDLGATAGPEGRFEIDGVPAGAQKVVVAARGFIPATLGPIVVPTAAAGDVVVALHAQPAYATRVVVTPGRHSIVREEHSASRALEREGALRAPTIGGDVSRLAELAPGVAAGDHAATFHVRGSAARDVSFIFDGLELYDPFHLQGLQSPFSLIDTNTVDRLDLLQGGYTAELGDRHGGFLRVETLPLTAEPAGDVEVGTLNARVVHRAPGGPHHGAWLVSARAWYPSALFETVEFAGEEQLDPRATDLFLKADLASGQRFALSGHALLARDTVSFRETDELVGERARLQDGTGYGWLRLHGAWSPGWTSETLLSLGHLARRRDGVAVPADDPLSVRDHRTVDFAGLEHDSVIELSPRAALKGGLDLRVIRGRYRYELDDPVDPAASMALALDPDGLSLGLYGAYRAALGSRLSAELGLRWDRQSYIEGNQISPRLNAVFRPGARTELRLAAGRFSQSQRIHELAVEDGETEFRPPEREREFDLTAQHEWPAGMLLRLDAYHRTLSRLRPRHENLFTPFELFPEWEDDRVALEPSGARLRGAELWLRGPAAGDWMWWLGYARSSAEDLIDGATVPRGWDQPHAGRFLVGYRAADRYWIVLTGSAHTGWPTTPATAELVSAPGDPPEYEAVPGPRNSRRYATYARLDLKARRAIALQRGRLWLSLEVINLTDRRNACCVGDFRIESSPGGTVEAVPEFDAWLGVTPSFAVSWEY